MEKLYTCTHCHRTGFTKRGLGTHRCTALGRGHLSKAEVAAVIRSKPREGWRCPMKSQLKVIHDADQVILVFQEPVRVSSLSGVSTEFIERGFTFPLEHWEYLIFAQATHLGFNPSIPLPIAT